MAQPRAPLSRALPFFARGSARTARLLVLAALAGAFGTSGIAQSQDDYESQDVKTAVGEFKGAFRRYQREGDQNAFAEMQAKLEAIQGASSDADVRRALREIDNAAILELLIARGDSARKIYVDLLNRLRAAQEQPGVDLASMREAIAAHITGEQGLFSTRYTDRLASREILRTEYGDLAVPQLMDVLGTAYSEQHGAAKATSDVAEATIALKEIRLRATAPLIAGLSSEDAVGRRNVLRALGEILDPASMPYLALHATEAESDELARGNAAAALDALRRFLPGFDGASFTALGEAYLKRDARLVDPFAAHQASRVWSWSGGSDFASALGFVEVPRVLLPYAYAKECFHRALAAGEDQAAAMRGLAVTYAASRAAGKSEEGTLAEQLDRASVPLRLLGSGTLNEALAWALDHGQLGAAEELIGEMSAVLDAGSAARLTVLNAALDHNDKSIAYSAALALAPVIEVEGVDAQKVLGKLNQAVLEQSVWIVHLVDTNTERLRRFASGMESLGGIFVRTHTSSAAAVKAAASGDAGDAIVWFETPEQDLSRKFFLSAMSKSRPKAKLAIFAGSEAAQADASAAVGEAAIVWGDVDPAAMRLAIFEALEGMRDAERQRADDFARRAAIGLRDLASRAQVLGSATEALIRVISDPSRPLAAMHPAVDALGRLGDATAMGPLADIFVGSTAPEGIDDEQRNALRLSAGRALARVTDRSGGALTAEQIDAVAALLAERNDLGKSAAAILGQAEVAQERRAEWVVANRENLAR
ncbi:MAG: hypothetical protein JNM84_07495 [Planctomycetes bacterium]|nr:hypothetical protein [Planctomycetota bacterium]